MFHIGRQHLEKAFHRHRSCTESSDTNDSHLLLLLYAIECGLKNLLLRRRGLHSTERLEDEDLTHDVNELLQKLGSRDRFAGAVANPGRTNLNCGDFHQVLRYGGLFDDEARGHMDDRARAIAAWIDEELS